MRHYEIVVMASSEQGRSMADRFTNIVTENGGRVHRFEDWGVRRLAYPIAKKFNASYFLYNIECDQTTLDTLQENFRFSESVMRTLITRRDNPITDASPILKDKEKRETAAAETAEANQADATQNTSDKPATEVEAKPDKSDKPTEVAKPTDSAKPADSDKSADTTPATPDGEPNGDSTAEQPKK